MSNPTTTGEWTAEYLHSVGIFTTEQMCDAHNAALDAEREKVAEVEDHNIRGVLHPDALAKHEQQLAAAEKRLQWWIVARSARNESVEVYECETPDHKHYWTCEVRGRTGGVKRFEGDTPLVAIDKAIALELANEGKRQAYEKLYDGIIDMMPQKFRQLVDAATIVVNTDSSSRQWIQVKEALRAALAKIGGK